MGKVSELIGKVVDGQRQLNRTIADEKFYTILVDFRGTVIRVLFSEYVSTKDYENDSKIKVTGCLMSDIADHKIPVFYIYGNTIESVDIDTETTNEISFSCTVTKVKEFKSNGRCVDILPLVVADGSPLSTTSVLYLCARSKVARKLKDKEKGYTITGVGYLKTFRDIYEIYINHVENLNAL